MKLVIALLILAVMLVLWFVNRPGPFRAVYRRRVAEQLAPRGDSTDVMLTDADLVSLPVPVQQYLRLTGAVGAPRVRNFRARLVGDIRSNATSRWMPFTADQVSVVQPASRLFLMDARMLGVPVQAYHEFNGPSATMRVVAAARFTIADAKGPVMDQAETVTLFNDLCVLAPGALATANIRWETIDARHVIAHFTNGAYTVSATLVFDDEGLLVDFVSDDRRQASPDGKTFTAVRWSTPLAVYQAFGAHRLTSHGDAVWHTGTTPFAYVRMDILSVEYNVSSSTASPSTAPLIP